MASLRSLCLIILLIHINLSLGVTVTNTTVTCCPDNLFVDGNNTWCRNKTAWIPLNIHCPAKNFTTPLGSAGETLYHNGTHLIKDGTKVYEEKHCIGKKKSSGPVAVICYEETIDGGGLPNGLRYTFGVISIIGCILTAITYGIVKEIRDLLGKSVIALCIALAIGLTATVFAEAPATITLAQCAVSAFTIQVFMLAAFFWMNAIAIQVYRMFASKQPSDRAYIWYSLYAWGSATLILIITLIINFAPNSKYSPEIGIDTCFFIKDHSRWIYLLGPMGVLTIINLCLFIAVAVNFYNLYNSVEGNRKRLLRYRILLFIRLFIVLGISWLAEIIVQLVATSTWYTNIADAINLLQGAFIFIVLVLLRFKALQGLAERGLLCCFNEMVKRRVSHTDCPETIAETLGENVECEQLNSKPR